MPRNTLTISPSTARLLEAGIVAGPLFIGVWLIQALIRDGFDPARHPMSLLSLGDFGWIQIANFVVAGALCLCTAVGLQRALGVGMSAIWGPRLVGAFGCGLIATGIFVADPGAGFPAGAPAGAPEHLSWHAVLHELGFAIAQLSSIAACVVLARWFARHAQRGSALLCIAAAISAVVIAAWPNLETLSLRLVCATTIEFALVAGVSARVLRGAAVP
jgi:hypothetical protein